MEVRLQLSNFIWTEYSPCPLSQWAGWGLWPLDLPIGVGGFCFIVVVFLLCLIVAFHCCLPSIHDDVHEFWATFG